MNRPDKIPPVPRRHFLCHCVRIGAAALALPAALAACAVGAPRAAPGADGPRRFTYGPHPSQFGELTMPAGEIRGVAVVVHGGFWRQGYGLELGRPLAVDLADAGLAAWNVEYRRVAAGSAGGPRVGTAGSAGGPRIGTAGSAGGPRIGTAGSAGGPRIGTAGSAGGPRVGTDDGGWTATFDDVAAAVDVLAGPVQEAVGGRLPLDRVVAVGHSAGGHLAAWLTARSGLPAGAPGASPAVRLRGAVSQAGVLDLVDAAERAVGGAAVRDLLGGPPAAVPDRYALASPTARVPTGVPVVCVHGTADGNVPIRQSERFVAAATAAGDRAELVALPDVDHFAVIDPTTAAWRACRDAVERLLR